MCEYHITTDQKVIGTNQGEIRNASDHKFKLRMLYFHLTYVTKQNLSQTVSMQRVKSPKDDLMKSNNRKKSTVSWLCAVEKSGEI